MGDLYDDVIWDWKKELDELSAMEVVGENFKVTITDKDHISCIDDIFFIIKKNIEYAIPVYKIEFVKLIKVDGSKLL